jgi:excisionase family DNA binding protein
MKTQAEKVVATAGEDRLLPVAEVARLLNVSQRTCWKLRYAGRLPTPVRLGRSVRWRASDVGDFIARGCRVEEAR